MKPDISLRGPMSWRPVVLAWLLVSAILLAISWQALAEWRYPDPDDTLRVVQVRDLLAGQPWFDLHQYRINPGDSPVMHWSRIVDLPLFALIALLGPLLGQPLAEQVAVVLLPLVTLGAIMAVVGRMARRLLGHEMVGYACLACGLAPLLLLQVQPLRVDHHGWQIFTFVLAVAALMKRNQRTGSIIAGTAMAAGLSISIELLPLAAAVAGVLWLRWLRDTESRGWLTGYLASLAAALAILFLLTRGLTDLTPYCDAVSPAHLLFFAVVALAGLVIARGKGLSGIVAAGCFACAGSLGLAAFLWQAPACLTGPFGTLDPLVRQFWYVNVFEGRPFWILPAERSVPITVQACVALAVVGHLWRTSTGARREWWLTYLLLLAAAVIAGLMVWRSMAFAGALSALPNGWLIYRAIGFYRQGRTPWIRILTAVLAICMLVPTAPVQLVREAFARQDSYVVSSLGKSTCDLRESVLRLDRLQPSTVFAPIDIGPSILERTRHGVVATGHHRAQLAMKDVILAYTNPADQARNIIARHGARYVVVCTDLYEPQIYADAAPNGLMAQLLRDNPPTWLREERTGAPAAFKVWRVVD